MKIREYKAISKVVSKHTVYMLPIPKMIGRKDYSEYSVGITELKFKVEISDYKNALKAFNFINKKFVDELKEYNLKLRDAQMEIGSKEGILFLFSLSNLKGKYGTKQRSKHYL